MLKPKKKNMVKKRNVEETKKDHIFLFERVGKGENGEERKKTGKVRQSK